MDDVNLFVMKKKTSYLIGIRLKCRQFMDPTRLLKKGVNCLSKGYVL